MQEQVNSHSQIKLPSLKHKESMNKSKQTLWPNSSITCLIQDRIQFNTSELVVFLAAEACLCRAAQAAAAYSAFRTNGVNASRSRHERGGECCDWT